VLITQCYQGGDGFLRDDYIMVHYRVTKKIDVQLRYANTYLLQQPQYGQFGLKPGEWECEFGY